MPNRLTGETSPYLLQHKDNPVDWWPWSPEAFAEAKRRGVPVFLSVGYSACHWCHVMEHESFENEAIAAVMNRHFVNIKVDREERPDVDAVYMEAVQMMTGRGGWPMSVFLTPEGRPFYGGTYWPPQSRMGMPGFEDVLTRVATLWETKREDLDASADNIAAAMNKVAAMDHSGEAIDEAVLREAATKIAASADRTHGGFGQAPKFPHPMDVRVLLRGATRFEDADALSASLLTLEKMARGGMYDQLGGGFHRYSTDGVWLVPHFEKMLYDQALLLPAYVEAWQILDSDDPRAGYFAGVVDETMAYLEREMRLPGGGLAATQDADSDDGSGHREEGAYFVWQEAEVRDTLGDDFEAFAAAYDVSAAGNWESRSILNLTSAAGDAADVRERFAPQRAKLLEARDRRIAPPRDDKVLTNWNGLMIAAAAFAGRAMSRPAYVDLAENAARFVLEHSRRADGRLYHSFKDGRARFDGFLDDYAAMIDGLCELYQARPDGPLLAAAVELADMMETDFADPAGGGYFYTAAGGEQLVVRSKDVQDNAVPSGNALAVTALQKLGLMTGEGRFLERADRVLSSVAGLVREYPRAAGQSLIAAFTHVGPAYELVLAGDGLADAVGRRFLPTSVVLRAGEGPSPASPLTDFKTAVDGQPTLYACRLGVCEAPVVGVPAVEAKLDNLAG